MKSENIIELKNITKTFSDRKILDNISLCIKKTGLTLVTGVSGVGKTTLIRIIMGLEVSDYGEVLKKEDITFSVVFSENRLFSHLTAFENVNIVAKNKEVTTKYLNLVGLKNSCDLYPDDLSTGMKRRLALARAFSYESDILILDEPFKSLDMDLKKIILKRTLDISKCKPVIIATHQLDLFKTYKYSTINIP